MMRSLKTHGKSIRGGLTRHQERSHGCLDQHLGVFQNNSLQWEYEYDLTQYMDRRIAYDVQYTGFSSSTFVSSISRLGARKCNTANGRVAESLPPGEMRKNS